MAKIVVLVVYLLALLLLGFSLASKDDDKYLKWRKSMISPETASSSSNWLVNRAGTSIVFPVFGNVYPIGYYNVTLHVGQPALPYFLDLDTGSDLTWLQCNVRGARCTPAPHPLYRPTNDFVACRDPICVALHAPDEPKCDNPEQCHYEVGYADGGSSLGVLVRDVFAFNYTNGVQLNPRLALGCGYDQDAGEFHHPLDGILGLGRGKSSILSQLHSQNLVQNIIGHCLSGRGGGFLFFGDDLYDSSQVVWTSMSSVNTKHYSPGFAELYFGSKSSGLKDLLTTFDSGSSYTYFNSQPYQALISMIKKKLSGGSLKEAVDDRTLPLCWKGRKPFKSIRDVNKYFKPLALALSFTTGRTETRYELTPEQYLIISSKGNVCLGILNGTEVGLQENLIGDISMQDRMVIYDNDRHMIGWIPANCDQPPKSKAQYM